MSLSRVTRFCLSNWQYATGYTAMHYAIWSITFVCTLLSSTKLIESLTHSSRKRYLYLHFDHRNLPVCERKLLQSEQSEMVSKAWITFINGTNIEIVREKKLLGKWKNSSWMWGGVQWMRGKKLSTTYDFTGFSSYSWGNIVVDVLFIHFEFTIFHNSSHSFGIIIIIHAVHCKSMAVAAFGDKLSSPKSISLVTKNAVERTKNCC